MSADPATTANRFLVTRDEEDPQVWLAQWVDDDRVHTFARSLAELEDRARDALALWLHTDADAVKIELDVALPRSVFQDLAQLRRQHDEPEESLVLDRQRSLAVRLVEEQGMTYRDAARFLGVSHQRVSQLVKKRARGA